MKKNIFLLVIGMAISSAAIAQQTSVSFSKQFETPKIDGSRFEKLHVEIGADFAMQFQGLNHHADSLLIPLGNNLNLPTANLNINADLAPGIRVNLETYLSARHHNEAWVKGGYLLIDALPFLNSSVADKIMEKLTMKVGVMELNYSDNRYFRSDNGSVLNNPLVGNYIMDQFTTALALELYYRQSDFLAVAGITSGTLKPALSGYDSRNKIHMAYNIEDQLQYYFKFAYDKTFNDNIRIRPSVSTYLCPQTYNGTLYAGDRTGSRYYTVMNKQSLGTTAAYDISQNFTSGNFGPGGFTKNTSVDGNLYAWVHGFELYGGYGLARGQNGLGEKYIRDYDFSTYHVQGFYHFGKEKQFFVGGRYNVASKAATKEYRDPENSAVLLQAKNDKIMSVDRIQLGGGWKMTKNIMLKLEYVKQNYKNFDAYNAGTQQWVSTYGNGKAGFDGFMIEAGISF
jgi:hypothetical protein